MDGYIGEIRLFAGNFPPRGWAFCEGQTLDIQACKSLFSVVFNNYGGDRMTTFCLPNLCGRVPMGCGKEGELTPRNIGENGGKAEEVLQEVHLPSHSHSADITQPAYEGKVNPYCSLESELSIPTGAYYGKTNVEFYSEEGVEHMALNEVQVQNTSPGSITVQPAGYSQPHNNMMPFLALSFIICIDGKYPQRI